MAQLPPKKPEPARGAIAGIKADLQKAKETGVYDPRGFGNAFTHNFLNQKPWHPMNYRNQIKKYEAEQQAIRDQKLKEQAAAEFQAEQESMKTMSYLSAEEQQRYKDRQSISFMYMKPPGLDAALAKEQAAEKTKATGSEVAPAAGSTSGTAVAAGSSKGGRPQLTPAQQEAAAARAKELDRVREDPFAVMLAARTALQKNEKFMVKHADGGPAHGGFRRNDPNQQLLEPGVLEEAQQPQVAAGIVADADDLRLLASMTESERAEVLKKLAKLQRKAEEKQRLEEAQAVLRAAGYDVDALAKQAESRKRLKEGKSSKKGKRKKSKKSKKRHKSDGKSTRKESGSEGSSTSSETSSDNDNQR